MAIQFLRGNTAANDAYTGPIGSYTIDTEKNQIRLHDGTTPGGVAFLNAGDLATTSLPGFMSASDKAKLNSISSGAEANAVTSVNGETGSVILDTGDIEEGTSLYHTSQRAISAIQADPSWNANQWDSAYSWGNHASAGYALSSSLSRVATTGNYDDLLNKPDLSAFDDVLEFSNESSFPATGSTGKVYVAQDTGYLFRWNGLSYTQLTDQTAVWGQVSGSLSNQSDLQIALDQKAPTHNPTFTGIVTIDEGEI